MLPSLSDMATKLDSMERDVDSFEAGFLSTVLPRLRQGYGLSDKQQRFLVKTYYKYFDADGEPRSSPGFRDDD